MNLSKLINPRSIAILGASERASIGRTLIDSLYRLGFAGRIYPINPKYPKVAGLECYPRLLDLPDPPDVVALCVGPDQMLEHVRSLVERGAGAAVIYAGGFA